jgi:acetyltransferase-like isoleucine patch superfamily enzyme
MISHRVEIMCGDSHSLVDLKSGSRLNHAADISIGNHVWLAADSAILKGSNVGHHSAIGYRAVVTGTIPAHSVAVGIPASPIRTGISWTREVPWQLLKTTDKS